MSSTEPTLSKPKSLCYRSSYIRKKDGTITEKEYFHNLFRHLTGIKHKGDDCVHEELKDLDPLGYSINCWILDHQHEPLDDCAPFENVFETYRTSNLDILGPTLAKLSQPFGGDVRRSLALLALQERNAEVLEWLLEEGISYEEVFEDEVRRVMKGVDPKTWKLLQDTAVRTKRPWTKRDQIKSPHPLW